MLDKKKFREREEIPKKKKNKILKIFPIIGMILFSFFGIFSFLIIDAVNSVIPIDNIEQSGILKDEMILSQMPSDLFLLLKIKDFEPFLQGISILCLILFFICTYFFFRNRRNYEK